MENRYDIAIIGTGPAGLKAAITAKVRNKNIILFGNSDLSRKMQVVDHPILNYLGLPSVTGKEMAAAFTKQLEELNISITEHKVTTVYAMGGYYMLQTDDNQFTEATTVILASGVVAGKPYPNEEKLLGRGVSYCATCDAPLYKDKAVAVIGGSLHEESEADFLGEICSHVYYFPLYNSEPEFKTDVEVIRERPVEILGENKTEALRTDKNTYPVDCVFVLREAQFPGQMVPGLETEGNRVVVDLSMKTTLPCFFAAGDITGQPYQYIKSAGQGNVAALSAVDYLAKMNQN